MNKLYYCSLAANSAYYQFLMNLLRDTNSFHLKATTIFGFGKAVWFPNMPQVDLIELELADAQ